ncbi:MAG: hypothetical protein Q6K99_08565, partial [Thermostichales cyanobacterium BF4_bins_65]
CFEYGEHGQRCAKGYELSNNLLVSWPLQSDSNSKGTNYPSKMGQSRAYMTEGGETQHSCVTASQVLIKSAPKLRYFS